MWPTSGIHVGHIFAKTENKTGVELAAESLCVYQIILFSQHLVSIPSATFSSGIIQWTERSLRAAFHIQNRDHYSMLLSNCLT